MVWLYLNGGGDTFQGRTLPAMCEALGLILSIEKKKVGERLDNTWVYQLVMPSEFVFSFSEGNI